MESNWEDQPIWGLEQKYWSVINQTGQIKAMPFKIEKDSSIIFR